MHVPKVVHIPNVMHNYLAILRLNHGTSKILQYAPDPCYTAPDETNLLAGIPTSHQQRQTVASLQTSRIKSEGRGLV